jgi:hypothetical protein
MSGAVIDSLRSILHVTSSVASLLLYIACASWFYEYNGASSLLLLAMRIPG